MSRYYAVRITDPKTNQILVPNLNGKPGFGRVAFAPSVWSYTSLYQGRSPTLLSSSNPNAQQIEFDISATFLDAPLANSFIRMYGVSLQEIASGSNLTNYNIAVYGGMAKGLPLANPAQIGRLCEGQIQQCFGNYVGTQQTLDIYVQAGGSNTTATTTTGTPATLGALPTPTTNQQSGGITFQWSDGQSLSDALVYCLQLYYPQYGIAGTISPNLVWSGTAATGIYSKLSQLATYVRKASINMIGGYAPDPLGYMGVGMTLQSNVITLFDGTAQTKPKPIFFTDLQGQPTLSEPLHVQATCVLRGDIKPGDYVELPTGFLNILEGAQVGYVPPPPLAAVNTKNSSAYQGSYFVTSVRHVGRSRDRSGLAWATVIDVLQTQPFNSNAQVDAQNVLAGPNKSAYQFYLPS